MLKANEENVASELPYTVVAHTHIPEPRLSITLTGEGIHALAKKMRPEDKVRITRWCDITDECQKQSYYGRIVIIRADEKEQ